MTRRLRERPTGRRRPHIDLVPPRAGKATSCRSLGSCVDSCRLDRLVDERVVPRSAASRCPATDEVHGIAHVADLHTWPSTGRRSSSVPIPEVAMGSRRSENGRFALFDHRDDALLARASSRNRCLERRRVISPPPHRPCAPLPSSTANTAARRRGVFVPAAFLPVSLWRVRSPRASSSNLSSFPPRG